MWPILIMMLHNVKENRWHPIFYRENPFPGSESEQTVRRFRSVGHHTVGFDERQKAMDSITNGLIPQLKAQYSEVYAELDNDLIWDGEEIPADNQLRDSNYGKDEKYKV